MPEPQTIPDPGPDWHASPAAMESWRTGASLGAAQAPPAPGSAPPDSSRVLYSGAMSELSPHFQALTQANAPIGVPQQQKLPPAPDAREYQKGAMEFASAMALLGAISSAFTRRSGEASLKAFAGALNGWQTGNQQAYENSAKKWEQDTKATIENNRAILSEYKAVLENRQMNIDQQMAQIKVVAAKWHDQMMYDAASSGNYTMVARLHDMVEAVTNGKLAPAYDNLIKRREGERAQNETFASQWAPYVDQLDTLVNPQTRQPYSEAEKAVIRRSVELYGPTPTNAADVKDPAMRQFIKEHPKATAEELQAFKARGYQPRSAAGMSLRRFIDETVEKEGREPTADEIQRFQARQVGLSAEERAGAGLAANIDIIMRNAHAAIPMAIAASEKVPRGTWVPINQLVQTNESRISDPNLKEFRLANLQLAELWARAMNPRGVMRESDRALALEILSTADSQQTYKRVTQQLANFLERERKSVQEFREHKEPDSLVTPAPTAPSPTTGDPLGIR